MLTSRLARIVDRIRALEKKQEQQEPDEAAFKDIELGLLGRRLRLIYLALSCKVSCGLIVGVIIGTAFIDAFLAIKLAAFIAALFVLAMVAFIGGLAALLREIFLAVQSTRASMRFRR